MPKKKIGRRQKDGGKCREMMAKAEVEVELDKQSGTLAASWHK